MSEANGRDRKRPLPDDAQLEAELARIDPRHWAEVRARVAALRSVLEATERGATARAAAKLGVTTARVYQLVRSWREHGSIARLAAGAAGPRRLPGRLPADVLHALDAAIRGTIADNPAAGIERVAAEARRRLSSNGARAPSRVTARRHVERIVGEAGGWGALAAGPPPRPLAWLVVDRATFGLPVRSGPLSGPEPLRAVLVVDRATGRIVAHSVPDRVETWASAVASTLSLLIKNTDYDDVALPELIEVDRDADPAWRAIEGAIAQAGARLFATWSPRPGSGRRLVRLIGARIAGLPVVARSPKAGGDGAGREPYTSGKAVVEPVLPDRAALLLAAAIEAHNAGRPKPRVEPLHDAVRRNRQRADLAAQLRRLTGGYGQVRT